MSLLRSVLRKNGKNRENPAPFDPGEPGGGLKKNYASSVVASIASMASFYSVITGGSKIPKRRRPDPLKFGAATFEYRSPPPAQPVPGVERLPPETGPYTAAHSVPEMNIHSSGEPRLCIVLYSHAYANEKLALYHDGAVVMGEVRMFLKKPKAVNFIDVWLSAKMDCTLEIQGPPIVQQLARVYASGRSEDIDNKESHFTKKKLPAGTHVFQPFSFQPLPQDNKVHLEEEALRENKGDTRVDLPPNYKVTMVGGFSGQVDYTIGLNVEYNSAAAVDDIINMPICYLPRTRPIARAPPSPPPLIPTREDWPHSREEIGDWTITPFGGRGRFEDDMVEVEGLLGSPYPPVYGWNARVPISLTLWSTNVAALKALSQPDSIAVYFCTNEVYGPDALAPRTGARKNRKTAIINSGRVWRIDESGADSPEDSADNAAAYVTSPQMLIAQYHDKTGSDTAIAVDRTTAEVADNSRGDLFASVEDLPKLRVKLSSPRIAAPSGSHEDGTFTESPAESSQAAAAGSSEEPLDDMEETPKSAISSLIPLQRDGPIRAALKPQRLKDPVSNSPSSISGHTARPMRQSPLAHLAANSMYVLPEQSPAPGFPGDIVNEAKNKGVVSREGTDGDDRPAERSISPASEGDVGEQFPGEEEKGAILQFCGEVPITGVSGLPSFNYKYLNRNYMIKVIITHPQYSHISPKATGVYAETSVWITSNLPSREPTPSASSVPKEPPISSEGSLGVTPEETITPPTPFDAGLDVSDKLIGSLNSRITLSEAVPGSPVPLPDSPMGSFNTSPSLISNDAAASSLNAKSLKPPSSSEPSAEAAIPNMDVYAHLPIIGNYVPLPRESQSEERRKLPLFRQSHTFGKKSKQGRPVMANRIESF